MKYASTFKLVVSLLFFFPSILYAAQCNINLRGEWGTGFTVDITIENDTDSDIDGWSIGLDFSDNSSINNMWNANLSGNSPSYTASNVGYNRTIKVGQSRSIGFNAQKAVSGEPAVLPDLSGVCDLDSSPPQEPDPEVPPVEINLLCEYEVTNEWGAGFTASVKLANAGETAIDEWQISMQYPDNTSIAGAWNAKLTNGIPLVFNNENYNGSIDVGKSVSFGFNANKPQQGVPAAIPTLGGMCGESDSVPSNSAPTADISTSAVEVTLGQSIEFDASQSSDPENDELSYLWQFGDGTESNQVSFSKLYNAVGEYTVLLKVNDGEFDSPEVSVNVNVVQANEPEEPLSYTLNQQYSSLYFVSSKKSHVIETHEFQTLEGSLNADGEATLTIDISSVETGVDIRNQRMLDYLFESVSFPSATLSVTIDLDALQALEMGETVNLQIAPTLSIKTVSIELDVSISVSKLSDASLLVQNVAPIIIDATDFGLEQGIETLRDLANLSSISYAVPTNFTLVFDANEQGAN